MKTVVFNDDIDFTIHHQLQVIGEPINDKKPYEEGALFNQIHDIRAITFFANTGSDGYGPGSNYIKVCLYAKDIKAIAAMIEKIESRQLEPWPREMVDDLPF